MSRARSFSLSLAALLASLTSVHGADAKTPRTDLYGDPLPPGAVARLGTVRLRHADADLAFSKNGKQLLSFGRDGELRVWDVATGELVRRKRLANAYSREAALSPDGTKAAAWCGTEVILYDTATGEERGRKPAARRHFDYGYDPVKLLAFSPDSKVLAVADQVWDFTADKISEGRKHGELTRSWLVAVGPNGKQVAEITKRVFEVSEFDGLVQVWDPATGRAIGAKLRGASLAFSPDGKTLAVGLVHEVRLLDTATLKEKAGFPEGEGLINRLTFSPDGRFLAGADYLGNEARLWDVTAAKKPRRLPGVGFDARFAFTSDSKILACQSNGVGSAIRLWDTATGRRLLHRAGHDRLVESLAISPDGKRIVSAGWDGVYLWAAADGKALHVWEEEDCHGEACLFSPDRKHLICAGGDGRGDGKIQVWDVATGKQRQRFEAASRDASVRFPALALSADGKRLTAVVVTGENSAKLCVWDLVAGKKVREIRYPLQERIVGLSRGRRERWGFAHAALSPDAEVVSVWRDGRVALEEVATGRLLARLPEGVGEKDPSWREHASRAMVFSPDARLVTAAILKPRGNSVGWFDSHGLSLIETATGAEIFRLDLADFDQVAFTPDSRGLVVTDGRSLRVWNTDTGERLFQLALPQSKSKASEWSGTRHHCLCLLPDGRAAIGTEAGDILIWDLEPATWPLRKPQRDLDRHELETLWSHLAGDARKAHRAAGMLTAAPVQTLALFQERLRPAEAEKRIEKLLADLDSDSFETREAATGDLTRLLYRAEPILRRALQNKPSLEARRRIEAILAKPGLPSAEDLRALRAIAVLERIGTPEARRILEKLAGGAAAPETRAAQAALQRLKHRDVWTKGRSSP